MVKCQICDNTFPPTEQKPPKRFCSRSCVGKWNMSRPGMRAKLHNAESWKASGLKIAAWYQTEAGKRWREKNSERMKRDNPMDQDEVRLRMGATLREIGHAPTIRGGNGRGPTLAEQTLLVKLVDARNNYPVATKQARNSGYPPCYKIDVAIPSLMLAIEIDGGSHLGRALKVLDAKKSQLLVGLGWSVLRFSNQEILTNLEQVLKSLISQYPAIRLIS